ncbi:acetyltransferase, ribosomal protein N-acetylase [Nitratireductor aquibiodomus RA22]|uniref:Acetyltransferase, ribosomal protein N-acetylase n=1 Tax=Nitratireductor aquibiodomus RA22 TaxID=1189611 RepID=I5BPZ9_9HYPH|nr:GNAT family N-acetyltransferase [Nitratireductor aquibiodomus]EIM71651.1 acetyltransferase, ribosomal protein N-acetylase [Nitratireductor aquibiodomus RA22]
MQKIEHETYSVAQTILTELSSIHVAIASVLDDTIDGEVWVDNPASPQVALVANGDAYYLAGNPDTEAETLASLQEIIPDWAYFFAEIRWAPHLSKAWRNAFAIPHPRVRMGYIAGTALPVVSQPGPGFEILPIDRALFDRNPGNLEVLEDCVEGWASPEVFFNLAVGYCALHNGQIVSHSVTDSVSGERCEVGVGTEPDFRRLGLGRLVASTTIAECIRRGLPGVEWHSHASNRGSIAIGRSIGLSELDRHVAYSCRLPAENIGDLDPDHCRELASHFERASEQINWSRFHAAGARALAGDREGALGNVRLLIEGDWEGEAEWLEEFWALQTLADDPEFKALLARKRELEL